VVVHSDSVEVDVVVELSARTLVAGYTNMHSMQINVIHNFLSI